MGASNKIQDTDIDISDKKCSECNQYFTEQDKIDNNFDLEYCTTNDTELVEVEGSEKLKLTVYVRGFTHRVKSYKSVVQLKPYRIEEDKYYSDCPDIEACENCYEKSLTEKMLQTPFNEKTAEGGDYFCNENCKKEHENKKPITAWEYCFERVLESEKLLSRFK